MKKSRKTISQISLILGVFLVSLVAAYFVSAWTSPSVNPPAGNTFSLLNVGIDAQAKDGSLVLGTDEAVETGLIIQHGKMGIGNSDPASMLDIVNGEMRISDSGETCSSSNKGSLRYSDSDKSSYLCNGKEWILLNWSAFDEVFVFTMADDGNGTATDITGASPYGCQESIYISASPNEGYEFSHWSAPAGFFDNKYSSDAVFIMPDQNVTVTANFTEDSPCGNNSMISYGGQNYLLVEIGNQCWFAENLNVSDGNTDNLNCSLSSKDCYQDRDINCEKLGSLYNWYNIMCGSTEEGAQGLCPDGWHIPTDDEVKELEMYLGMSEEEANSSHDRGTDEGDKLKDDVVWDGTNTSGFTAIPSGWYDYSEEDFSGLGTMSDIVLDTWFWTSTGDTYEDWALTRHLDWESSRIYRGPRSFLDKYSVRCLKDQN